MGRVSAAAFVILMVAGVTLMIIFDVERPATFLVGVAVFGLAAVPRLFARPTK